MRTTTLCALAAGLLVSTPVAADDWTGVYMGGGIGVDAATADISIMDPNEPSGGFGLNDFGGGNFGAGLRAGADWQISDWVVLGAFATYDWSTVETSASFSAETIDESLTGEARLLDLQRAWAVGGRIGLVVSPATLAYGMLGYTRAKLSDPSLSATAGQRDPFTGAFNLQSNTASLKLPEFDGIVFGVGVEHRITSNISLWGEYRQSRFDAVQVALSEDTSVNIDPTLHLGRVGISYRFGGADTAQAGDQTAATSRTWTGAYVAGGFGVDGIEGDMSGEVNVDGIPFMVAQASGVGGGDIGGTLLAGYDAQFGKGVLGAFVSYDRSAHDVSLSLGEDAHLDIPSLGNVWTIAARAGYLVAPDMLAYALAGYTYLEFSDWTASAEGTSVSLGSPSYDGITVGLGFEKLIGTNFAIRSEYRYTALSAERSSTSVADPDVGLVTANVETDPAVHSVRLLGVYRFSGL